MRTGAVRQKWEGTASKARTQTGPSWGNGAEMIRLETCPKPAFASKRAWDPGKWSSLPLARIWRIASHPSPKPGNYVDQCLWKISGFGPPISKKPASHNNQIKVRAQNRTCLYVRFWASFMFFPYNLCLRVICLIIFSLPVFSSICFLQIRFRWVQIRGVPASTDDDRPETPAIR